ncbi:Holliday junction resolvase RecU [Calidifontibacillus oryziterrae]|uniref:Holliday junction resolvase RecU n=1 Tax=Calidifontibacillus oryziterrae TaxID=1191699 RepID=UPI0002F30A4F|nr:Holliday junction resolvase RecU [Calidifontibacillus oryziterrae]
MTIRYPNGQAFVPVNKTKNNQKRGLSYSNRGMTLEDDINETNEYYLACGKAVIHKKPTPIQIVSVDYPKRSAAVIKEAYFKLQSTTDYNGVYRGRYIDFEAKETKNKTSFPLKNFHEHQITHMKAVLKQNGICFVLLRFSTTDEIFFLKANSLFTYWDEQEKGGRKSIPKADIEQLGNLIPISLNPRIDYLQIIDQVYFDS